MSNIWVTDFSLTKPSDSDLLKISDSKYRKNNFVDITTSGLDKSVEYRFFHLIYNATQSHNKAHVTRRTKCRPGHPRSRVVKPYSTKKGVKSFLSSDFYSVCILFFPFGLIAIRQVVRIKGLILKIPSPANLEWY